METYWTPKTELLPSAQADYVSRQSPVVSQKVIDGWRFCFEPFDAYSAKTAKTTTAISGLDGGFERVTCRNFAKFFKFFNFTVNIAGDVVSVVVGCSSIRLSKKGR